MRDGFGKSLGKEMQDAVTECVSPWYEAKKRLPQRPPRPPPPPPDGEPAWLLLVGCLLVAAYFILQRRKSDLGVQPVDEPEIFAEQNELGVRPDGFHAIAEESVSPNAAQESLTATRTKIANGMAAATAATATAAGAMVSAAAATVYPDGQGESLDVSVQATYHGLLVTDAQVEETAMPQSHHTASQMRSLTPTIKKKNKSKKLKISPESPEQEDR